jgi:predicted dehydrogenase
MPQTVRFGIIGCGRISRAHLQAIAEVDGAEAVAAADINEAAVAERADEFGIPNRYADWKALVADDAVDAVSICLPHNLHHRAALDAAAAGKHILTEKPMCNTLAECDDMIRAAEGAGVVLMVAQVLRRYPCNVLAKRWIQEGRIGRVASVVRRRTSYGAPHLDTYAWATKPEVTGGWLLYGFGSHEFDAILWLLDTQADTVFAVGNKADPRWNDYDEISAVMRLANGASATMIHSLNCREGAWDCVLCGTEGTITTRTQEVSLNGEKTPTPIPQGGPFREQVQEFVDCVRTGSQPGPSGHNVRATMQVLEAVKLSLAEGRPIQAATL